MNVTIKQVKAFVAVAQTRSFAEASVLVHLSQPALSITIKNLEALVGGRLIARTTKTLALTPEGEVFYPVAKRLLADWDSAMLDLHNHFAMRRGKLAIAVMPSFASNLLSSLLVRYRERYPDINVSVQDVVAENVVEMVRQGRVELGVSFDPGESEGVSFEPLFLDRFVAVFPDGHPLLEKKRIAWEVLQSDPFLLLQRPSNIRHLIEKTLSEHDLKLRVEFEAHQLDTIGCMVASGLGVSAVPSLCTAQMERQGAVCRPLDKPFIARRVGIITRQRYPLSSVARAMVEVLMEHFAGSDQTSSD